MRKLPTVWLIIISAVGGIAIGFLIVQVSSGNVSFDDHIRLGEITTWVITITLYLGTPILLKRYVDDEREVKKMVNEEISLIVKETEALNTYLRNGLNKEVTSDLKDTVLISFEILEKNVTSIARLVKECISDWQPTETELKYFKYKNSVTNEITRKDFVIGTDFYNRQLLDLKTFQDQLKEVKIKVMRS